MKKRKIMNPVCRKKNKEINLNQKLFFGIHHHYIYLKILVQNTCPHGIKRSNDRQQSKSQIIGRAGKRRVKIKTKFKKKFQKHGKKKNPINYKKLNNIKRLFHRIK